MSKQTIQIKKSSGEKVDFSIEKLKTSLRHSGAGKADVDFIINVVRDELYQGISTREIYNRAFALLKKKKSIYASKYKLKKAIYELGPTGFPFERFVGQVLTYSGYDEIKVGAVVQGTCVQHEVDVVARKGEVTVYVECKFHGEEGRNCNVKVPLYIHSRYQDIIDVVKNQNTNGTEGWVVTNTRFTKDAIDYGICAGLELLSWDYPKDNGIKDRIDRLGLYPITVSTDVGFKSAGFNFKILAELEQKRIDVASLNHPRAIPICGDLTETWADVVATYRCEFEGEPLQLLTACPPCQGFSSARGLRGNRLDAQSGMFDERNTLMTVIPKVALELNPSMIIVENVPAFLSRKLVHPENGEPITGANFLIETLSDTYKSYSISADLADFGIPQTRKRSVIVFISRNRQDILEHLNNINSFPFPIPSYGNKSKKRISVKTCFENLNIPSLSCEEGRNKNTEFNDLHEVVVLDEKYRKIIKAIPRHSGLSGWDNNECSVCSTINNKLDIYCQKCNSLLSKPIIKSDGKYRLINGFSTSYKRMRSENPAATVLTASGSISSHNTIHPYEDRPLSAYECQVLQTFPDDFRWGKTKSKYGISYIRHMIGEAVPPKFTRLHGRILISLLKGNMRSRMMKIDDLRIKRAQKNLNI